MTYRRATLPGLMSLAFLASPAEAQLGTEMKLTDAGFVMRVAKSPRQLERLGTIPARRLVARTKDGVRHYLYADPAGCQSGRSQMKFALTMWRCRPWFFIRSLKTA